MKRAAQTAIALLSAEAIALAALTLDPWVVLAAGLVCFFGGGWIADIRSGRDPVSVW